MQHHITTHFIIHVFGIDICICRFEIIQYKKNDIQKTIHRNVFETIPNHFEWFALQNFVSTI